MFKSSVIFLLIIIFPALLSSQELQFERAFPNGDLPQIPIALLQDSKGFLWIGTTDGLYRYDGRELQEHRYNSLDTASLSNNYIRCLYEDQAGNIWIGTANGLNCFNPRTEQVKRYTAYNGLLFHVLDIMEDHQNRIWFGSYDGLYQLDPRTDSLLHFVPEPEFENTLSNKLIWSVFEDDQQRIWAGTQGGFTVFKNDDQFNFQPYFGNPNNENGLDADRIFDIVQDSSGHIWLSSYGLYKVIEKDSSFQFQSFKKQKDNPNSLSHDMVQVMQVGPEKNLWVGTYQGGLNRISFEAEKGEQSVNFQHFKHKGEDPASIRSNKMEAIEIDQSGLLWVGTGNGLDKASNIPSKFNLLEKTLNNPKSLSNNIIKSVFQDSYGNLWVGTYRGLNFLPAAQLNNKNFQFEHFYHDKNNAASIAHNNIFGIHEDQRGYLWISTFNGLNYFHIPTFLKDREFNQLNESHGLPHNIIYNAQEIRPGEYWLSTYTALCKLYFDPAIPETLRLEKFEMNEERKGSIVNSTVFDVIQDKFGDYWIGTFGGVSKYTNQDSSPFFENYINVPGDPRSLSNNSFRCFFKDSRENIWIGTRGGLNLVQQEQANQRATFKVFGIADGFPNDVIHAIEEDNQGKLWISTNKGLVVFDSNKSENPVLKTYTKADGLASSSFVFRSSFKDAQGYLYFGTGAGLNYFNPDSMATNAYVPPVVFTKLKILNEAVLPGHEKGAILHTSIAYTREITLKHWQNIIDLEFVALDFHQPENNQYQYQLSSLHKDWVDNGTHNKVTFTNLSPGQHILSVKGSNNDGIWNESPTRLTITVLPPFWKTWWAYTLYILTGLALTFGFIQQRIQKKLRLIEARAQLEKARQEEREQLRKKNAADFHDELGHRLTKIALFSELAQRQASLHTDLKKYLDKIKLHTAGLSHGVRDLIWSLDPDKDSLYQTLLRLQEFGDHLFEFSPILFKTKGISTDLEKTELAPDVRKHILLIFKEAMNNALKYSSASEATLEIKTGQQNIQIIFQDNGAGFDQSTTGKGYGLKNMQSRASKIQASLRISAAEGRGTRIQLTL